MVSVLSSFNGTRLDDDRWVSPPNPDFGLKSYNRAVGNFFLCLKGNVIETTGSIGCLDNVNKNEIWTLKNNNSILDDQ